MARGGPKRRKRPDGGVTRRKGKPRASLAKRVREQEAAIQTVGEKRIRPGRLRVGSTGRLTPTRAGFRALDGTLKEMQRTTRKGTRALWTADLNVRFRGPDGEYQTREIKGAGLPRPQDVKRARRSIEKRRGKRFKSDAEAFRHMVETTVKAAVFRTIDREKTVQGDTDKLLAMLEDADPEKIRKAMRAFKSRRSLTFRMTVNRLVTRGAGGTKGKARRRIR